MSAQPLGVAAMSLGTLLDRLSARTPTPGGGAAAAISAAIGCAVGAMAARYTTGKRWADRQSAAEALARTLEEAAGEFLSFAESDVAAYGAVSAARAAQDPVAVAAAEALAAEVPAGVLGHCAATASALAGFRARCNPQLVSDIDVAIALLAGAGHAAAATLDANPVEPRVRAAALAQCDALRDALAGIAGGPRPP
jgi:formiminotetrahydrofolate cyclodeaminase